MSTANSLIKLPSSPSLSPVQDLNPSLFSLKQTIKLNIPQHEPLEAVEKVEYLEDPSSQLRRTAAARQRHEADLVQSAWVTPQADRVEDDWQVAYVWAFIQKFSQMAKIPKLECLEDFERCLSEPVANRPDDILEGILTRFVMNLKPGLRNVNCTNIQKHLSDYISETLKSSPEFTVWDRPWPPNEEQRGSCCISHPQRHEWGRLRYTGEPVNDRVAKNPLKQIEEKGGGLFELDWRERARLLRQLVDWQLSHSEVIRSVIDIQYKTAKAKKDVGEGPSTSVVIEPLGLDRKKQRIWAFDASGRVYKSGNPFKRPCPLISITQDRAEMQALQRTYAEYGSQEPPKLKASGSKAKPTVAETKAYKLLVKGIEEEGVIAQKLAELLPAVEKEEARVSRARKRIADAARLAEFAETRNTRTRRSTKKVDYAYDDDVYESDEEPAKRRGVEVEDTSRRPVIPGERQSARVRGLDAADRSSNGEGSAAPAEMPAVNGTREKKGAKGYAWIEEEVPYKDVREEEGMNGHEVNGGSLDKDDGDEGKGLVNGSGKVNGDVMGNGSENQYGNVNGHKDELSSDGGIELGEEDDGDSMDVDR